VEENENSPDYSNNSVSFFTEETNEESENKNGLRNQPPKKILFTLLAGFIALIFPLIFLAFMPLFLTEESEIARRVLLILTLNIPVWLWFIHKAAFSDKKTNSKWRKKSIILLGVASFGSSEFLLIVFMDLLPGSIISRSMANILVLVFFLSFLPNLAIFIWSIKQSKKIFHQYNSEVKDKLLELDEISPAAKVFIVLGKVVVIFLWYNFLWVTVFIISYSSTVYNYGSPVKFAGEGVIALIVLFIFSGSWAIFVSLPRDITKRIIFAACLSIFIIPLILAPAVSGAMQSKKPDIYSPITVTP
jgi:hypothetical protein